MRPVERVDPFMGTDNVSEFSNGNLLPLMGLPWGAHHYSPSNAEPDGWFFQYRERAFRGLRLTHSPSPWMGDWCPITFMPQAGERRLRSHDRTVDLPSKQLRVRPHRFGCVLPAHGIEWDAAPTMHGLAMRLRWRHGGPRRIIVDSGRSQPGGGAVDTVVRVDAARSEISLRTHSGEGIHPDFALHLVLKADAPSVAGGRFDATGEVGDAAGTGVGLGGWLEFPPGPGEIQVWAAGSFIDAAAAYHLLEAEVAYRSVDVLAATAAAEWDAVLGRVQLPASSEVDRSLVATAMYRTLLYPRRLDEPAPAGPRHRCPDTGVVRSGVRVTDHGFWDTARTVYPWYALAFPDLLPTILDGWVQGARATGWFPSWASPGHRVCMTGSYADAVFADAVSRGIPGFDAVEVLTYLRRHAEEPVPDGSPYGREAVEAYLDLGYVPVERIDKAAARTLDYAYGDWCLAVVASAARDRSFAEACRNRAANWRHVLDQASGFFRGRHADGGWQEPFDPFAWGGPFVEGSAWQFAWHVPHQPQSLIEARGGRAAALRFLEALLAAPATYTLGSYPDAIHEMRELAAVDFGQYAHSNQPSHFTLPYLGHLGRPDRLAHWVRRVIRELHALQPDGYPGDEDNGEMSAWWLTAAMGLLPSCPGNGAWQATRPTFPHLVVDVPQRPPLEIRSGPPERAGHHWWRAPDGTTYDEGSLIPHAALARGGTWWVGA